MMTLLLKQVAVDFQEYCIVMVVDRATWQMSTTRQSPDHRRLLPLPSGSPELHPTEPLWDDVRDNEVANHLWESLDQVESALGTGIKRLASQPERLRSLTNFPYMKVGL
jgi:putative transposase